MKLSGEFSNGTEKYFLFVNITKSNEQYLLFSQIALEDLIAYGQDLELKNPVLNFASALKNAEAEKYFVGGISRSKATGKTEIAGSINDLQIILDTMRFAKTYVFDRNDVTVDDRSVTVGTEIHMFSAHDSVLRYDFEKSNAELVKLKIVYGTITIQLEQSGFIPLSKKQINFVESNNQIRDEINRATLENIHYADLVKCLDMGWYKDAETECVKKKYYGVHTIDEFEDMYTEMIEAALASDEPLVVALDTETTGVFVYDLAKDNPTLDRVVEISISFKDDESYCIFTDMEYIQSVSNDYCWRRLSEIFTEDRVDLDLTWDHGRKHGKISRDKFHLVGQNFPFDRRAAMVEGYNIWFDDDTLVMGFNVSPKTVRGNVSLKNMTRRLFGHETPELSDVLGKGNEDKYRYLADEEVARIYAGADSDYTRKVFFVLKRLLGPKMYKQYHNQDVWLLNVLAKSEYEGLRTEEEGAKKLAYQVEQNLKILEEAAYFYVGAYMDYQQKMTILEGEYNSNLITEHEYLEAVKEVKPDPNAKYEFEFKGADIRMVMYDVLKYPIIARTDTGLPKTDKFVRKKLMQVERKEGSSARKLNRSILVYGADYAEYEMLKAGTEEQRKRAENMELINVEKFNSKEYPMALLFEQYAILNKEYTSYFKPMVEHNLEGKIFNSYSLARIETRRIMNPSQTMKKNLKDLIIPYSDDYYTLDFDLSQIELRLMYSLSGLDYLIEKMKNPESDGHTENAAMVNHIPAYKVTKYQRRAAKGVSFGVPYGLGERSLCETIHKDQSEEHLVETRLVLYNWKKANAPIVDLLENARDGALEPVEISEEKRQFMDAYKRDEETKEYVLDEDGNKIPIPLGAVYNQLGFCRYFDISNIDQSPQAKARRKAKQYTNEESTIRRAAGNYPIQAYAAEFFRTILHRFYDRCKREGIADKVKWNMLIHDELLASVHKSVNPIFIMKLVKEACMITMKGHTNYFVGINMGDTWGEAKDDDREAPVLMVNRLIKRWDAGEFREQTWFDHPWEFIRPLREQYVQDRIYECIKQIQPDVDTTPLNVPMLFDKFDNYTVRAYVYDYPKNSSIPRGLSDEEKDNAVYQSCLESWAIDVFGEGKEFIGLDGKKYIIHRNDKATMVEKTQTVEDDFAFDFEDEIFDFDEDGVISVYFDESADLEDEYDDPMQVDIARYDNAKSLADMLVVETKYQNLKLINNCIVISVDNDIQTQYLQSVIKQGSDKVVMFQRKNGQMSVWKKAASNIDLFELDNLVSRLRRLPNDSAYCMNDRIIFTVSNNQQVQNIMRLVQQNKGFGYKIFIKDIFGRVKPVGQVKPDTDFTKGI